MARVPLAGTDYIPGVSEERSLRGDQDAARPVPREPGRLPPRTGARPRGGGELMAQRRRRARAREGRRRSTPSTSRASASPTRRTSRWSRTSTSRRLTPGQGPELARGRRAAGGGGHARGLRPLLELVPPDLLHDPQGPRERDRAQGPDGPPDRRATPTGSASRRRTPSSPSPSSARGSRTRRPSARTGSRRCSRAGSPRTTSWPMRRPARAPPRHLVIGAGRPRALDGLAPGRGRRGGPGRRQGPGRAPAPPGSPAA